MNTLKKCAAIIFSEIAYELHPQIFESSRNTGGAIGRVCQSNKCIYRAPPGHASTLLLKTALCDPLDKALP